MKKVISLLLLAALMLGLSSAAIAAETAKGGTIRLEENSGTVKVTNASGKTQTIRKSMRLYNGYKVSTGRKSEAYVSLDDTKVVKLDSSTKVDVKQSGKQLEVSLSSGKLFFNVTRPLKADETLNISTSTMVTGVRGSYGWVTPTEVGLMHGHVIVTCRNPYTGEMRVTELVGGERVYFDPNPQVASADPSLLEIDFVKELIRNSGVPATVVREMAKDAQGLCDPVIEDVPTIDVPALLASLPELEQKEEEVESDAAQALQTALREEEASLTGDGVSQVFETTVSGGGSAGTPNTTAYVVKIPQGSGYTVASNTEEIVPGSGEYSVKRGESFAFTVIPDDTHAIFADDLGAATSSGAAVTQTQNGTSVNCSLRVRGNETISFERVYRIVSEIDQGTVDADRYLAASGVSIISDVTLPADSAIRIPAGESLDIGEPSTVLTLEENSDLIIEGTFQLMNDTKLINNSTNSIHVFEDGSFFQMGDVENYGHIVVEGTVSAANGYGAFQNNGTIKIASGATVDLNNISNGDGNLAAHDSRASLENNGDLTVAQISNHGVFVNNGSLATRYTVFNYNQMTNNGTFVNDGAVTNGDTGFDPAYGYGTFVNNGTFENNMNLYNYSFNTLINRGTINNNLRARIRNSGTFENESVINNQAQFISVGPISGSGTVNGAPVDETGKYILRFDNNGGVGTTVGDCEIEPGATVSPAYQPPTGLINNGFTLTGWCSDKACTHLWDLNTDPVVSDMVLYARWE